MSKLPGPIDAQEERRIEDDIRGLPQELRYHIQHVLRNYLQAISGDCEMALDASTPHGARENLRHIRDILRRMSGDLMELGL